MTIRRCPECNGRISNPPCRIEEVQDKIVKDIADGNRVHIACLAAGVTATTYHRWLQSAKDGETPFLQFAEACESALARAEVEMIRVQLEGDVVGDKNTSNSARFWLTRSRAKAYGDQAKLTIEVDSQINGFLDYLERHLDEQTYARILSGWHSQESNALGGAEALGIITGRDGPGLHGPTDVVDTQGNPTV